MVSTSGIVANVWEISWNASRPQDRCIIIGASNSRETGSAGFFIIVRENPFIYFMYF